MLADFQQALADIVASPPLCRAVRANAAVLRERYLLTDVEARRLADMARQAGMTCNCILYRANRLAPLALNFHDLSQALGDHLTPLVDEFWQRYPEAHANFLVECNRFGEFIRAKQADGLILTSEARQVFDREYLDLQLRLLATYTIL